MLDVVIDRDIVASPSRYHFMNQGKQRRTTMDASRKTLVACFQCDLVQYEMQLERAANVYCARCNALLYSRTKTNPDLLIALTLGAALLFLISNLFPIALMEIEGVQTATLLSGTAIALYQQGRPLIAALVFLTTIVFPALELAGLLYLLVSLRLGLVPRGVSAAFRFLLVTRLWNMIDVFLLGALVTLVKLSDLATVILGIALWAFAGSVILSCAISASFSGRDFWMWMESTKVASDRNTH